MNEEMKILLEKIKLEDNFYKYFKDANLKELVVEGDDSNTITFFIGLKVLLPCSIYEYLMSLMVGGFNNFSNININIASDSSDSDLIMEYLDITIKNLYYTAPIFNSMKDNKIEISEGKMFLHVENKNEMNKFAKHKEIFEIKYNDYGFDDFKLEFIIDEPKEIIPEKKYEEVIEVKSSQKKTNDEVIIGNKIFFDAKDIRTIISEESNVVIEAKVFAIDLFESKKSNYKIITLKVSDDTDSIYVKLFFNVQKEYDAAKSKIKENSWYKIQGFTKDDKYARELVLTANSIVKSDREEVIPEDNAPEKRIELHAHTLMSQMDSVVSEKDLIKRAKHYGHRALAITDHNSVQAFPTMYHNNGGIKLLYGVELNMIDDTVDIVFRDNDDILLDQTFVVFDYETTGFNAGSGDQIIEAGAVKIKNGEIIDKFSELIDPGKKLQPIITEVTGITDEMLVGCRTEKEVIKDFIKWCGDDPMVAHNAKFDASFLEMAYKKYDLGTYTNTLIDTLELSRVLDSGFSRHNLATIVKRYKIVLEGHHRAVNDAEATALVFDKMMNKMNSQNIELISDINKMVSKDDIHKIGQLFHINLLATNNVGLKNLFQLVSLANTKYLHKTPRILRSELVRLHEGIIYGSSCANGEVFTFAQNKNEEELSSIMSFYDYIEIQPPSIYNHLIQSGSIGSEPELQEVMKKVINVARKNDQLVVATGDVHHLDQMDKVYREIIINQRIPGGGFHPLNRRNITDIPSQHFMTTEEMLDGFKFIGEDLAKEIVITNTHKIADMIEDVTIIKKGLYAPKMDKSDEIVRGLVYDTANSMYSENLPEIVKERIEHELSSIIGNGFDVIYLISQKLVKKSNDDGYLVGSRGSVGSSFVATMMGITEVNPLPAHYLCPSCQTSIFEENGKSLGATYLSGYDLPDRICTCGSNMKKEGQDMPFATFLGFNGDKTPDIDLNFSGEYQGIAHDFTKEMFGETKAFRAGTISTVADKTAFGFVLGYIEKTGKTLRRAEIERLALGCTGVKRTSGQHPGGIIVIPQDNDITDFTPYQYPADDTSSEWKTTHFDFHAIDENVLKLDILGHDDPTMLKMLGDLTGLDIKELPFDDKDVLSLFSSNEALNLKREINTDLGTLGIPEFGTRFVLQMLTETKPSSFAELVKISGLSHGTDVWVGNAKDFIAKKVCEFKEVIGCRDDIMVYLMYQGLKPIDAFTIMEVVRKKGKYLNDDQINLMKEKDVPAWYIESCYLIKYMFPKAHATAYVMMALRVAWFKVHMPIYYYATYFSVRCHDFDIQCMIKGYDAIKERLIAIQELGYDATNKENNISGVLDIALEMAARDLTFDNISLDYSDSDKFVINEKNNALIPPFRTIDGLGTQVASNIIEQRKLKPFLSIEDMQNRCKISNTIVDKLRFMGVLDDLPESSQLSLF